MKKKKKRREKKCVLRTCFSSSRGKKGTVKKNFTPVKVVTTGYKERRYYCGVTER